MLLVLLDVMYLLHHVYEGSISHSHSTPQKPWWMQGIKHTSLGAKIQGVFNVNGGMKTSQYEEDESYSLTIHIKIC